MKLRMAMVGCVTMLAAVVWVQAQESGDAKPKRATSVRLTMPWNKISSLSDDQKAQIREIHGKALSEINAIREKESADIMALLTDEQKAEAERLLAAQKTRRVPSASESDAAAPASASDEKKSE